MRRNTNHMDTKIKNYLGITIIATLILSVAASFWYMNSFSKSVSPDHSFSVNGEGKVVTVPDIAQLSFGVLAEGGKNLADLQTENTKKANRVIAFLKESGVEDKDIKTQSYNITPRYQYFSCPPSNKQDVAPCPPSEIVGYSISQDISVKIRELHKTGAVLAGIVEKGANTVSGPAFIVDDPTELENQAREEAITEAKNKAKTIAEAGGFRIGKLISIQEGFYSPWPISNQLYAKESGYGGDSVSPSIEPGSQEILVNVTLAYEIE